MISIYDVYTAFEGQICCWDIYGCNMINKVVIHFFTYMCSKVGLHEDYITSTVGHTCVMWQASMFRGICQ